MSPTKMLPDVRVGDVWADNDGRLGMHNHARWFRVVEIDDGYAMCETINRATSRRRTQIALRRFRPNSTGYRLIERATPKGDRE